MGSVMSPRRWLLMVLTVVALGALVLAAPAAAGGGIGGSSATNSCNAGAGGSDGSDLDDGDSGSGGGGGSCNQQSRSVRQRAGGDASFSITQRQGDGDGDRVRISRSRSRNRDRDDDDEDRVERQDVTVLSAERDELDCRDFSTQAEAQDELDANAGDPNRLDADDDGRACEETFTQFVSGTPDGGVETGGGGTLAPRLAGSTDASPANAAEVARTLGPAVALGLILVGVVGLRRGRAH